MLLIVLEICMHPHSPNINVSMEINGNFPSANTTHECCILCEVRDKFWLEKHNLPLINGLCMYAQSKKKENQIYIYPSDAFKWHAIRQNKRETTLWAQMGRIRRACNVIND